MPTNEKKETSSTSETAENKSNKVEIRVDNDGDKVSTGSNDEDLKRNLAQTNLLGNENVEDKKDDVKSNDETESSNKLDNKVEKKNECHEKDKNDITDKNENKTNTVGSDKAETEENTDKIFSITGLQGLKLPRHRDTVTVFPSGCMGIPDEKSMDAGNRRLLQPNEIQERDSGHIESTPRKRPPSARQIHTTRNPLTGEGYDEKDFIIGTRRKEVKPVDKRNAKRIPPGGFSTPLW